MSERKIIHIGYRPRDQFRAFHKRKQRWSALVCHRRAGKTVATLNDLIRGAVNEPKSEGRYAFIFPQRNQAKDTAWRYLRPHLSSDGIRASKTPDFIGPKVPLKPDRATLIRNAIQTEFFGGSKWREVVSPDGVRCHVTRLWGKEAA
jgi:hypothetical protein